MAKVKHIYDAIDKLAPFCTQMSFDNAGLLVGDENADVLKAVVALDVTDEVIEAAVSEGAQLLITHHPIMFSPVKRLLSSSTEWKLANAGLSLISAHTNLDLADGGVNDCLAEVLELKETYKPNSEEPAVCGILQKKMKSREFAQYVCQKLKCEAVGFTPGCDVQRVTVIGGAGSSFVIEQMEDGVDAVVTGETKHHIILQAKALGKTLVVAGHHETERVVLASLTNRLRRAVNDTEFILLPSPSPMNWVK